MNDSHDDAARFWEGEDRTPTGSIRRIGRDVTGQIARVVHDHHEKHRFDRAREHRTVRVSDATPVYIQPYDYDLDDEYGSLGRPDPAGDAAWRDVEVWTTPVADHRPRRGGWVGVDRRLMRVGVIAAAAVVLAPVLIAVASGDRDGGEGDIASPQQDQPAVVAPQGDPATSTIPITAAAVIPITAAADNPADDDLADNDTSLDGVSDKGTHTATASASAEAAGSDEATAAEAAADDATAAEAAADEAAADPEPDCSGEYTVVDGDYWYRIAGDGDVDAWFAANDATIETPLYAGDALCIPEGATAPPPPTTAAPTTDAPAPTDAPTTEASTTEAAVVAEAAGTQAATTEPPAPTTDASTTTGPPTTTAAPVAPPPPPPSPTTPPATAAPGIPTDPMAIIRSVWPDELEERALTIARRESGLVPTAYNGWCCYGLFQIYFTANRTFLAGQGVTSANQLLDAYTNARVAYAMYQASGWRPWSTTDPG